MARSLQDLFWDTNKAGKDCARLAPWLYPDHKDAYEVGMAVLKATQPEKAEEVEEAYRANEEEFYMRNPRPVVEETVEEAGEVSEEDAFRALSAGEQRAKLAELGIEGDDSNADKRTALYLSSLTQDA